VTKHVEPVNGRMPLNYQYAGETYPVELLKPELREKYPESVRFNEKGFPDFSPYARETVEIRYTGDRADDFDLANEAAGLTHTPEGYSWHHHEDAKTMQLVPTDLHKAVRHTGGCATSGLGYND
jgi:filamentous hemagglutinin